MINVNNGDGKTRETAIRIMCADDPKEGWDYIKSKVGNRDAEYISMTEDDGYEAEYLVFRIDNEQIWFDWTWLYLYMR